MMKKWFSALFGLGFASVSCLADPQQSPKMRFINIVPFFPDRIDYMAEEAVRLYRTAGINSPAYCMTLHPEGPEPIAKAQYYAKAFAALKKKLEGTGVRPGILIQAVMGHGWNGQMLCGKPWQYTINIHGGTTYRMCPLDPGFREYVRETFRLLAPLRPAFFLTDDDIRLINNSSYGLECFCPLHMAEFNAASPRKFTAEELRTYLADAPAGDETARIFDSVRRKSLLDLAKLIRSAIDETDESIPCGCCIGGREYMLMEELAKTFAGKNEPFLRIHNALYLEERTHDFPIIMYHTNLMRKAAGSIPVLLDEADTCPHNRFSKSVSGMHSHIVGGILNGLSGAKLWLTNLMEPEAAESAEYEKVLAEHRGFYDTLLGCCSRIDWLGPRTLLPPKELDWRPAKLSAYYDWHDWQWQYMNRFGIPGSYGEFDPSRITLLTGDAVRGMSAEELRKVLSGKVLLDGDGAFAVHEKGLSGLIGAVPHKKEFRFSFEYDLAMKRPMRFLNDFSAPSFELLPGAVPLTELRLRSFASSPDWQSAGTGTLYFENAAGGRVITTAVAMSNIIYNMLAPVRKQWLLSLFERLDGKPMPFCANDQDVYMRYGVLPTGENLAAVINLSFGRLEDIRLQNTGARSVKRLDRTGKWINQKFRKEDGMLILPVTLSTYENAVFKLTPGADASESK